MATVDALKALIHKQFDIAPETIAADEPFASYNIDSLTLAELVFAIDDEFKIEIPDTAFAGIQTLNQLAALVDGLLAQRSA